MPRPLPVVLLVFVGRPRRASRPLSQRFRPGSCAALTALPDACAPPDLAAEVIEPRLADLAVTEHLDPVDARRVDQEGALDADAVRHTPHREVPAQAAAGDADDQ